MRQGNRSLTHRDGAKELHEFQQRAVDLVIDSGHPVAQIWVDICVNEGTWAIGRTSTVKGARKTLLMENRIQSPTVSISPTQGEREAETRGGIPLKSQLLRLKS